MKIIIKAFVVRNDVTEAYFASVDKARKYAQALYDEEGGTVQCALTDEAITTLYGVTNVTTLFGKVVPHD